MLIFNNNNDDNNKNNKTDDKKNNNNVAIIYGISTIGFFTYFAHFFEINPVYFWNVSGRYRTDDRTILVHMVSKDILSTEMKHIIFLELCLTYKICDTITLTMLNKIQITITDFIYNIRDKLIVT